MLLFDHVHHIVVQVQAFCNTPDPTIDILEIEILIECLDGVFVRAEKDQFQIAQPLLLHEAHDSVAEETMRLNRGKRVIFFGYLGLVPLASRVFGLPLDDLFQLLFIFVNRLEEHNHYPLEL